MSTKKTHSTEPKQTLAITSYGLKSVTGNRDFALFGAVATLLCNTKEEPKYEVPSPDGSSTSPATVAPISAYEDQALPERIMSALTDVLLQATEKLTAHDKADQKYLFLIVTPASVFERSHALDTAQFNELLTEEFSAFKKAQFHFLPADNNVTKNLTKALLGLDDGKLDTVIFAGCDSLVNDVTCTDLLEKRKLKSTNNADGIIPGEAAACVVIQKIDITNNPTLAIISSLAFSEEPNSGKAHETELTGLRDAILSVTQQTGQTPDDVDCIVRNSTTEQHYEYEWYQISQRLWPNTLSEQQRVAYQQGELDTPPQLEARSLPEQLKTSYNMGEVGAASIPLNMVLAGARFDFNYPTVNNCLICEANEFLFRGAILLKNPHNGNKSKVDKHATSRIR